MRKIIEVIEVRRRGRKVLAITLDVNGTELTFYSQNGNLVDGPRVDWGQDRNHGNHIPDVLRAKAKRKAQTIFSEGERKVEALKKQIPLFPKSSPIRG